MNSVQKHFHPELLIVWALGWLAIFRREMADDADAHPAALRAASFPSADDLTEDPVVSTGVGGGSPAAYGSADATPVFNYAGSVNGSTTTGPVAGSLPTTVPTTAKRRI